jgi:hypothetical protein
MLKPAEAPADRVHSTSILSGPEDKRSASFVDMGAVRGEISFSGWFKRI